MNRTLFLAICCLGFLGCGQRETTPPTVPTPTVAVPRPYPPQAVSSSIIDAWEKAGINWLWCGSTPGNGAFCFTTDLASLDFEQARTAVALGENTDLDAISRLPHADKPFGVALMMTPTNVKLLGQNISTREYERKLLGAVGKLGTVIAFETYNNYVVPQETFSALCDWTSLEHLTIHLHPEDRFTENSQLAKIHQLRRLKQLEIGSDMPPDISWISSPALLDLERLSLKTVAINDQAAVRLSVLPRLSALELNAAQLTAKELQELTHLKEIRSLKLISANRDKPLAGFDGTLFPN